MPDVSLALVIHAHQPVGNFDHVIEDAYRKSYAPFVGALLAHPRIQVSLHLSGILLEWIEQHHPEYFQQLRELTSRGQVEMVGGGYYEPILPAIPDADKIAQVRKLSDYIGNRFLAQPRGAWVAERVWEPTLPRPLVQAGVEYVILDDTHFLSAGLQPDQLHGTYVTEEDGFRLRLVPSLKSLRYTIPFQEPGETLKILREGMGQPGALFAVGDDYEKFGIWPGTYDHVYKYGWMERFLSALEASQDWLATTTVSGYLRQHPALGLIYLPTASYAEMMEWALPPAAAAEFKACMEETEHLQNGARFQHFLHGGLWRNFLSKYSEANQIQKQVLWLSHQLQKAGDGAAADMEKSAMLSEARQHLLAAQCNDPYWHGIFGGLYAPHLRTAVLRHAIQAESQLDRLEGLGNGSPALMVTSDLDGDGQEEVLIRQSVAGMILRPADGGTVSSLRFKPAQTELVNSLMRRPEPYHALVRKNVASSEAPREGPASIHDQVLSKEANLEALLRYDRYARHAFRTYLFPAAKTWQEFEHLSLQEDENLARGAWQATTRSTSDAVIEMRNASEMQVNGCRMRVEAAKVLTSRAAENAWHLECRSSLATDRSCPTSMAMGLELVINLLAPDAHDRYFQAHEVRRPLEFRGEIESPTLTIVDEWQRVKIVLEARPQARWWIVPIQTVSQSELGFERVYQGSAIMPVWKIDPPAWRNMNCVLRADITLWQPTT